MKGCLELKGYSVAAAAEKNTFVVSNLRDNNYYELTAPDEASMLQWIVQIKSAIARASSNIPDEEEGPVVNVEVTVSLFSFSWWRVFLRDFLAS